MPWIAYAAGFLAFALLLLPGAFWLAVRLGQKLAGASGPGRRSFIHLAYALVPLGLTAWIAFSLSFVFANGSYLWPALSDPLGRGWDLLGTAGIGWTPYLTGAIPALQVGVLLAGFVWAGLAARRIATQLITDCTLPNGGAARMALPVVAFNLVVTLAMLALLIG